MRPKGLDRWLGPDERRQIAARLARGSVVAVVGGAVRLLAGDSRAGSASGVDAGTEGRSRSESGSSSGFSEGNPIARSRGGWAGIARRSAGRSSGHARSGGATGRWRPSARGRSEPAIQAGEAGEQPEAAGGGRAETDRSAGRLSRPRRTRYRICPATARGGWSCPCPSAAAKSRRPSGPAGGCGATEPARWGEPANSSAATAWTRSARRAAGPADLD